MVIFLLLCLHHDLPCREIGVVVSVSSRVIVWTHLKLQSRRIARVTRHALANYDVIFPSRRGRRLPIAPETSEGSPWKIHRGRSRRGTDILRVKYHPEHIRTLEKRPVRVLDIAHVPQYAANLYVNRAVFLLFFFLFFLLFFPLSFFFSFLFFFIFIYIFFTRTELSSTIRQNLPSPFAMARASIYLQFKCHERRMTLTFVAVAHEVDAYDAAAKLYACEMRTRRSHPIDSHRSTSVSGGSNTTTGVCLNSPERSLRIICLQRIFRKRRVRASGTSGKFME